MNKLYHWRTHLLTASKAAARTVEGWPLVHCVVAAVSHSFRAFKRSLSLCSDTAESSGDTAGPVTNPMPRATDARVFIHAARDTVAVVRAFTRALTTVVVVSVCAMFVRAHLQSGVSRSQVHEAFMMWHVCFGEVYWSYITTGLLCHSGNRCFAWIMHVNALKHGTW